MANWLIVDDLTRHFVDSKECKHEWLRIRNTKNFVKLYCPTCNTIKRVEKKGFGIDLEAFNEHKAN